MRRAALVGLALTGCGPDCPDSYGVDNDGQCVALDLGGAADSSATDSAEEAADPEPGGGVDTGWSAETPSPSMSAAEVAAALEAALADGIPEPDYAMAQFIAMFDGRDATCPVGNGYNLPADFDGCRSTSGYFFAGLSELSVTDDVDELSYELLADFQLHDDQERWFYGGGSLVFDGDRGDGSAAAEIEGTWSYPGAEGWLARGFSGSLWLASDGAVATAWGAATIGDASVSLDLTFDASSCEAPTGELGLRDDGGQWYEMELGCDGCGAVRYGVVAPVEVGEACVSLAGAGDDLLAALEVPTW